MGYPAPQTWPPSPAATSRPTTANLGYTFTFGGHDHAILARSLIADIALPALLIAHIPAFYGPGRAD